MAIAGVPQTAARDTKRKNGEIELLKMKASTTIFKGGYIGIDGNGLAVPWNDAANIKFGGVAYETVTSDASTATYIRVEKNGAHLANAATGNTFTQAMLGLECYVNSDNQVTTSTGDVTNAVKCGKIHEFISTAQVYVLINGYC